MPNYIVIKKKIQKFKKKIEVSGDKRVEIKVSVFGGCSYHHLPKGYPMQKIC